jgi:hypothetical protein
MLLNLLHLTRIPVSRQNPHFQPLSPEFPGSHFIPDPDIQFISLDRLSTIRHNRRAITGYF